MIVFEALPSVCLKVFNASGWLSTPLTSSSGLLMQVGRMSGLPLVMPLWANIQPHSRRSWLAGGHGQLPALSKHTALCPTQLRYTAQPAAGRTARFAASNPCHLNLGAAASAAAAKAAAVEPAKSSDPSQQNSSLHQSPGAAHAAAAAAGSPIPAQPPVQHAPSPYSTRRRRRSSTLSLSPHPSSAANPAAKPAVQQQATSSSKAAGAAAEVSCLGWTHSPDHVVAASSSSSSSSIQPVPSNGSSGKRSSRHSSSPAQGAASTRSSSSTAAATGGNGTGSTAGTLQPAVTSSSHGSSGSAPARPASNAAAATAKGWQKASVRPRKRPGTFSVLPTLSPRQEQQHVQQHVEQQQQGPPSYQKLQELCRHPQQWQQLHKQQQQQQQQHQHHTLWQQQRQWHEAQQQQWQQGDDQPQQQQQQQWQQQWPPKLMQCPPPDPVTVDVSELLSWPDCQPPQIAKLLSRLPPAAALQQLLWVSVHQPQGPGSTAAVWVGRPCLQIAEEQLRLAGEKQVLLQLQQRPDCLGQVPAVVVDGLTFAHSSSSVGSSAVAQGSDQPAAAAAARVSGGADVSSSTSTALDISSSSEPFQERQHSCSTAAEAVSSPASFPELAAAYPAAAAELAAAADSEAVATAATGASSWYDYLLLVTGDFSVLEHENMFPNVLTHCGDGRTLHHARDAFDLAGFVAEAERSAIKSHTINLIRWAWDKRDEKNLGPDWIMQRLEQRWGFGAMLRHGVDMKWFNECFSEAGVVQLPLQAGSSSVGRRSSSWH